MVAPEDQKEEAIAMEATVTQALPNAMFEVELENGHKLIAYAAGRMRRFFIRITPRRPDPGRALTVRPDTGSDRLPI